MRKILLPIGLMTAAVAGAVSAHPTDVPFANRGECEAAFAESSKLDRQRLVDVLGVFDSYGEAQRTFRDRFVCVYDEDQEAWFIVDRLQM